MDGESLNPEFTKNVKFCSHCANLGTKTGCPICFKIRSADSLRFERYRNEEARIKALPLPERRDRAAARNIEYKRRMAEIDEAKRLRDVERSHKLWWEQLRDFQMTTTGDLRLDATLREKYGDWETAYSLTHNHPED